MYDYIPDNPYLLLTPGPLSTSKGVRNAMLRDWCTWDADYNEDIVQNIRRRLVQLACPQQSDDYTAVLMQGSGSFGVEATLGTALPQDGKLLILTNGAYGQRMVSMAKALRLNYVVLSYSEIEALKPEEVAALLAQDSDISHVALVHCETTTGMLNPIEALSRVIKAADKILIVDAMSSFGGIPIDVPALGIDYLVSSSNKCIQGTPGFSFVIAKHQVLADCGGNARSHSLDLYDQWKEMDATGKWRFTSPTHIVRAFLQALDELDAEGGIYERGKRYRENHRILVSGMDALGFKALLPQELQSPIITSFLYPGENFNFPAFYQRMKTQGFVLYPGKISQAPTFRVGNIGEVYPVDIETLLRATVS